MEGVVGPWGLAFNIKQQLVVAEFSGPKVIMSDKNGKKVQTIAHVKLINSAGVAVDKDDNIYVTDHWNSLLHKFSKEGKLIKAVGQNGTRPREFNNPSFIKVVNDRLYVCDRGNHRVQILNTELEYMDSFGCHGNGDGQFKSPNDIAQDRTGNLYVTDIGNDCVQVFDCKGRFLYAFNMKGVRPYGICVGSDQLVYVSDVGNNCVSVFQTSGEFVTSFGQFSHPYGIVTDNDGFVYVSDFKVAGTITIF